MFVVDATPHEKSLNMAAHVVGYTEDEWSVRELFETIVDQAQLWRRRG